MRQRETSRSGVTNGRYDQGQEKRRCCSRCEYGFDSLRRGCRKLKLFDEERAVYNASVSAN